MSLLSGLTKNSIIASVLFVLAKLMFIPTIICIFSEDNSDAYIMISIYSLLIISSILLCLFDSKKVNKYDPTKDGIYNGEFKVIIKDGKIIKIL